MSFHFAPSFSSTVPLALPNLAARQVEPRVRSPRPTTLAGSALECIAVSNGFAVCLAPDPLWAIELDQTARRIRDLQPGWDGPGSGTIAEPIIRHAVALVREALSGLKQPAAPYLMPAGDGRLQIQWDRMHAKLEFCLEPDGSFDIWGRDLRTGVEFEGEGSKALALFHRRAPWAAQRPADAAHGPAQDGPARFDIAA